MPSILRRLFGESTGAVSPAAGRPTRSAVAVTDNAAPMYTAGSAHSEPHTPAVNPLHDRLRADFLKALRRVEVELVSDDPITADLALMVRALRDQPIDGIRQLPVAAHRAMSLMHGDVGTKQLVELFEQDPAISQGLLQQVNSAYYNPTGARIVSLPDAINRMGRAGVQSVLMQQCVAGMMSRPGGHLDAMVQQVWNHMVRVAPLARRLAPAFGADPEQAFLLGLLHDVGKLVVFDRASELRTSLRRVLTIERRVIARALLLLHEPLGGLVVQNWGLDGDVARVVASHHRDPRPPVRDVLSEVIYLAERIDLIREMKQTPDLVELWNAGGLTGSLSAAAAILDSEMTEQNGDLVDQAS